WFSWFKGIEIANCNSHQLYGVSDGHIEVRQCYSHDDRFGGADHEGIDFLESSWVWIDDNMCVNAGFPQIILGDSKGGCMGSVISYNFVAKTDSGSSVAGGAISVNHG